MSREVLPDLSFDVGRVAGGSGDDGHVLARLSSTGAVQSLAQRHHNTHDSATRRVRTR